MGSCREGADLQKIQDTVQKELERLKKENPKLNQQQLAFKASHALASRGYTSFQTEETSHAYKNFDRTNALLYSTEGATLQSVRRVATPSDTPTDWNRDMSK